MEDFVDLCPKNYTEVQISSTRLGCGQDQYKNDQYICVPNIDKTGLVEMCYNGIMGIIQKGNCLETDGKKLYRIDCLGFSSGCPDKEYRSNTIYQYPACQNINTQHNCYLAESSCPNITRSTATKDATLDFQSTPIPQYESNVADISGSLAVIVLILVILIIAAVLWRKKNSQKNGKQENNSDECEEFLTTKEEDNRGTEKKKDESEALISSEPEKREHGVTNSEVNSEQEEVVFGVTKHETVKIEETDISSKPEEKGQDDKEDDANEITPKYESERSSIQSTDYDAGSSENDDRSFQALLALKYTFILRMFRSLYIT